jgi:acetyl-CoA acetyltransferase family protein
MTTAVIVDALRTALGRRNGQLSGWHPVDLAARTLAALVERNDLDPALIDDVVMGCSTQIGAQSLNVGRSAALAAGFPESVGGTTVERQGASSQQALHYAAQGVMAGQLDVVIAAGVEVMSLVPMGADAAVPAVGAPFGPMVAARFEPAGGLVPQGVSAELVAERWNLTREELDEFAARSQELAGRAAAEGRFEREILPVACRARDPETGRPSAPGRPLRADEPVKRSAPATGLGRMKPVFVAGGKVTAGNSAQIADGAAAVLVMSEERAASLGRPPRARFHSFALSGVDPIMMLTAPIPATTRVLERAKLGLDDIDVIEINETFASAVLAWAREHHPDMDRVNPNGGAIALGHPLGCSGARLMTTLLHELERSGGRWGLQVMGEGGGLANATVIERLA